MEKILLALGALALLGSVLYISQTQTQVSADSDLQVQFQAFKTKYNKKYSSHEDNYRFQVYAQNVEFANQYNAQKGKEVFGETLFFDLTDEEFAQTYLIEIIPEEDVQTVTLNAAVDAPTELDWRQKGAVTPIKNQGQCGSCWAFSTTGVLEGFFARTTGELPSLSEQQLVDCAGLWYGNLGCNGGMPARALNYVQSKGITTEAEYAYTARQDKCVKQGGAYKVRGKTALSASEQSLIAGLQNGPVSVAVDATNWKYYDPSKQEVFEDCDAKLNHAVLAVGYAADHVLVKNSWSTKWGLEGYIKVKRAGNTCGLYNAMVQPQ